MTSGQVTNAIATCYTILRLLFTAIETTFKFVPAKESDDSWRKVTKLKLHSEPEKYYCSLQFDERSFPGTVQQLLLC